MNRSDLLQLIEASLAARQPAYARQVAQRYLVDWPSDLGMQFALARACAVQGEMQQAATSLEALTAADPEEFEAQRLLGDLLNLSNSHSDSILTAYASAHVGDGLGAPTGFSLPDWAISARAARLAERIGDWETARHESEPTLEADTPSPLPSLTHLCALWHAGQLDLALPLVEGFHARWPQVVAFKLCLAECLLKNGDRARALELLHDAAAQDVAGQVAERHWGATHPYTQLWDVNLTAPLPGPLPAELITALGLNRLTGAQASASQAHPPITASLSQAAGAHRAGHSEEIADIQLHLDAIAERLRRRESKSQLPATDYHYVILSSRTRLIQVFDLNGFAAINDQLKTLAVVAAAHAKMRAWVLYVDDAASLKAFGLQPVDPTNAWEIKTLLGDLAAQWRPKNEAIGALLIVGGAEIIPFHHLPNPTDDPDPDIPSDNPYATPDENYFVPEWPVGRIPSGAGNNPEPLLRALQNAAKNHGVNPKNRRCNWLVRLWRRIIGQREESASSPSFGYSANVWKHASLAVYTTIGDPRSLLTCPPVDAAALPAEGLAPARLSYFNLHGIEDGPEWYGQRSTEDMGGVPEYPVALRPSDVSNQGRAPAIVFSEACFGANILGKTAEDALCLRFLDSGSRAMIASTKIAYGSVTTPLIGADLLGFYFWQNVTDGLPAGEALRRAKLRMAQEMHARQGFLDGEDQKTLIEFVLYGDPLACAPGIRPSRTAKRALPHLADPPPMICDKSDGETPLTPEAVARIKSVVAQYLPGMRGAQWRVAYSHAECTSKHNCPTAHLAKFRKSPVRRVPHTAVVTLSKTLHANARAHSHYARLTLDESGAVVKLAVSR
jgi:peptidase C25-like protein/tetratricopeptide repeat protein